MKKVLSFLWISILISIFLFNCQSDTLSDLSIRSVLVNGFVTDNQGQPVDGASVEFGSEKTSTNEVGYFEFPSTKYLDKVFIKVYKQGYFPGSRTLFLKSSETAEVRISLLQKTFSQSFQSNTGSTIQLNNKVSLNFQANSILNADATPYQGIVQIAIQYLDPSSNTIHEIMPGNLIGLNTSGEMQVLGSYGMAAIELQSPSGALLQLDKTKGALLKLEIPQSLQANAPATIPLWYFDEDSGLWKEEGAAIKSGNKYEGRVNHFSFWNCDKPWLAARIQGRLVRDEGMPIPFAKILLTIVQNDLLVLVHSNSEGIFETLIPKNEKLNFQVFDFCDNLIYQELIGPYNADVDLGQIVLQFENDFNIIEGQLVDDTYKPLDNFSVYLLAGNPGGFSLKSDKEGRFTFRLPSCVTSPVTLSIYGLCNEGLYSKNIGTVQADLDLGQIVISTNAKTKIPIDGKIVDCNFNPMPNVSVIINSGTTIFKVSTDQSGNYKTEIAFCNLTKITIKAYDENTQVFSDVLSYNYSPDPIHVANLHICKDLLKSPEYLTYQFSDGITGSDAFNLTLENSFGLFSFFTNTSDPWFNLKWNGPGSVGTLVPIKEISLRNSGSYYIAKYYNNTDGTILFKSVAKSSGEFFEGTFEGINIKKQDVKTGQLIETGLKASGSFKIKKE